MQPLKVSYTLLTPFKIEIARGPFSNYVDKMRGRGSKMSVFVHAHGIKTVHARGWGQKLQNAVHVVVECPLFRIGNS